MQYKPWIIIVIGVCHLLEPVAKIIYYSILLNQTPLELVIQQFYNFRYFHIFNFFITFPIAGVAILSVKKWSLPVFLLAQIIVLGDFLFKVPTFYESGQIAIIASSGVFYFVNISLVTYFLGSSLKMAYLDSRIRWWESFPRYAVNIPGESSFGEVQILDLSRTGAYVSVQEIPSSIFNLKFKVLEEDFTLNCLPVHEIKLYEASGCGVEFKDLSSEDRRRLRRMTKKIEQAGYKRRPEKVSVFRGFNDWLKKTSLSEKIFPLNVKYKRSGSDNDSSEKGTLQD